MRNKTICLASLVLSCLFVAVISGENEVPVRTALLKVAANIEKGDFATAKAQARVLAESIEEIEDIMAAFNPRIMRGLGVGPKPDAILPDGIEAKLLVLARQRLPQGMVNRKTEALEKMAYIVAAVAEVAIAKPPLKDDGKKKKKDYLRWAKDMREAAPGLAAAAKLKSPADIQNAARNIVTACASCHVVFRD